MSVRRGDVGSARLALVVASLCATLASALVAGCGGGTSGQDRSSSDPLAPPGSAPPPAGSAAASRPAEIGDPPAAAWEELAASLGARDATAPAEPLRWQQPSGCALRYGLDSRATLRAAPAAGAGSPIPAVPERGTSGVYRALTADWSSIDGRRAHVVVGPMQGGLLLGDLRTPPAEVPAPPAFDLELGASRLRAPADASPGDTVWGNLGTERGLASFWPDLSTGVVPGSRASFALAWGSAGAAQGKAPALEETITVELVRWIEVGGVRAAVLDAWSTTALPDLFAGMDMPLPSSVTRPSMAGVQEMRARYVVLASGRLLHARVHDQVDTTITIGGGTTTRQVATKRGEVRLLAACDGPVAPPFPDARKPGELAMVAVLALQRAVHEKDLPRALAAFAPTVLARHGKPAVEKTLRTHVARYQAGSVGAAGFTDVTEEGDGITVTSVASADRLQGGEHPHAVLVTYRLRAEPSGMVVTSMRSAVTEDAPPILQIDALGLSTSATTDPAPK